MQRQPVSTPFGHRFFRSFAVIAVATAALMAPAHAQWQWKDRNGQVTASDRPPPKDVPDKDILSRPTTRRATVVASTAAAPASAASSVASLADAASAGARPPADRELEARKRAADQEQAAKTRADEERTAAARAENCRRARNHQAALDGGQRIARVNDRGEREVLDDKGRADEVRQARDVIASDCR